MPSIRILPDQVANQIAAGEVVERPVAVVKELVENSLDAGATRIEVAFSRGGKSLIRVEDNGFGMSADESMLALERHATSKIRSAEDLNAINSFGFRGEALPSVASVSRFTLSSRRKQDDAGSEIFVNGGKLVHQKACGMAAGTVIEVAHLFNSVPARRKFLKTDKTEASHIIQCVRLFALAHPNVSFSLKEEGRWIFRSPACEDFIERVGEAWSRSLMAELVALPVFEEDGICVRGAVMRPSHGRSARHDMQCFVNSRPVDNRTLTYAILESYRSHLPRGRFPAAFLFVDINPAFVDVNVHPAKREVRFRDEGGVRRAVIRALSAVLSGSQPKQVRSDDVPLPKRTLPDEAAVVAARLIEERKPSVKSSDELSEPAQVFQKTSSKPAIVEKPIPVRFDWTYLGLLRKPHLIALFETSAGLVLMRCRAAHERVEYERACRFFESHKGVSQPLLIPISLDLDPVSSAALEPHLECLKELGLVIEPFGRHFYRVESLPQCLDEKVGELFVRDMVEGLRDGRLDLSNQGLAHEQLALLAATRALQANDSLSEAMIVDLARELLACKQPMSCPKGRPTLLEWSVSELSKKFGLSFT